MPVWKYLSMRYFRYIFVLVTLLYPLVCLAQSTELTSRDSQALLYAHQLNFSSDGVPMVRMRIADGMDRVRLKPKGRIRVYPMGPGGCSIELAGNQIYEISMEGGHSGKYAYRRILARTENMSVLEGIKKQCESRGHALDILTQGSLFALKGNVFDNRETLLLTPKSESQDTVEEMDLSECGDLGEWQGVEWVDGEPHVELMSYPEGNLVFEGAPGRIIIRNHNLLWIELPESGAVFYDIPNEQGRKTEIVINGMVAVTPDKAGLISVVQLADVETILRGIVPGEIFASAPEAALMAQAIAARTTLLAQVGNRHLSDPYHLCNFQHCQMYLGLSGVDSRTDKAIKKTRGQLLFDDGRKLVHSYYSAHCGGFSAGRNETWGLPDKNYLRVQSDDKSEAEPKFGSDDDFEKWWNSEGTDFCRNAPEGKQAISSTKYARWMVHVGHQDIERKLRQEGHDIGVLQNIEILERGKSFRVIKMRLVGTKGEQVIEREYPIRKLFGLKSALFIMKVSKNSGGVSGLDFYGSGFGHGVGLCQTGAIGMAQRGFSAAEILMHYYPGTRIETLW